MSLAWLAVALVALAAAWFVGSPAWTSARARAERDTNTERYLAWRGRARERPAQAERWTPDERRRLLAAGAMALVGLIGLVAFFVTS